jgi:hypothetical protein
MISLTTITLSNSYCNCLGEVSEFYYPHVADIMAGIDKKKIDFFLKK